MKALDILRLRDTDRLIIIPVFLLVAIGVLMIYSTSYVVAMKRYGNEYYFLKRHGAFVLASIVAFVAATRVPYTFYRKMTYPILLLAIALLVCIYIPGLGFEAGGARRWVRLGPIAFQPSEPAKLAVIIFLAYSLSSKADRIKTFAYGFLPNIIIPGIVFGLILFETDLGTASCVALIVFFMNFIAGVNLVYLGGLAGAFVVGFYLMVTNYAYMMNRILVFLDPWKDPGGAGYQIIQSFLAFGSGGLTGVGIGESKQKLLYLPEAHTDFIFSVLGEELGLLGVGAIVALYVFFLIGGTRVALKSRNLYATYLAAGLTLMVVLQAVLNMGVVLGLLPPKGLPLPFISYGGTSLVVNMAAVGILLNIYIKENEVP